MRFTLPPVSIVASTIFKLLDGPSEKQHLLKRVVVPLHHVASGTTRRCIADAIPQGVVLSVQPDACRINLAVAVGTQGRNQVGILLKGQFPGVFFSLGNCFGVSVSPPWRIRILPATFAYTVQASPIVAVFLAAILPELVQRLYGIATTALPNRPVLDE